jgi:Uri superfamily endonuclease
MLRCRRAGAVVVGSLGSMSLEPAVYLYVGSAFGPGGLAARLARHASRRKVERWHIDYLRPRTSLVCVWFSPSHLEHDWAARALALPTAWIPLPRFGASDCSCPGHLIRFPDSDASLRSIGDILAASKADSFGLLEAAQLRRLARRSRAREI